MLPGRERLLFLLCLFPGLATLAIIRGTVSDAGPRAPAAAPAAGMPRLDRPRRLLLLCVAVWALAASSEEFLLLRAAAVGVPAALVPAVWFGIGITKSLSARLAAPVIDRLAPRRAVVCGWLVFMAGYADLALADACIGAAGDHEPVGLEEPGVGSRSALSPWVASRRATSDSSSPRCGAQARRAATSAGVRACQQVRSVSIGRPRQGRRCRSTTSGSASSRTLR